MGYRRIDDATRQGIIEDYEAGVLTCAEIAEKYSVSRQSASNIALRAGIQSRHSKRNKPEHKEHVCPKCKKKIDIKGAKFCPFCGSDIRTENEILAERLTRLSHLAPLLPESKRDELVQTVNEAANKIRNL